MKFLSLLQSAILFHLTSLAPTAAEAPPYFNDQDYDEDNYGSYPTYNYRSSDAIAPRVNFLQKSPDCESSRLTFLSPRGYHSQARRPRAVIMDSDGVLIWSSGWDGQQIYNLKAQRYKGKDYITFWAGNDAVGGHGEGDYYMLDENYQLKYTVSAANGLRGDPHEFLITDQGTVMMTMYQVIDYDLTPLGKSIGPIWDSLMQEIDIETGELLFEWRASEHRSILDTYRDIGGEGEPNGAAFDWFHINSVDKDHEGNYIISSRYLHSVTKVDGKTGKTIWIMGGKSNMFKDLSGGNATNFAFQHDARWSNNDFTEITLFDNGDDGSDPKNSRARGIRIRVDQEAMTASLITEYNNPHKFGVLSQGSMQTLPSGHSVVGYGVSGAFTEFDHEGNVLCDVHFGPQVHFGSGGVQSYRVLKFPWKGLPSTDPDLAIAQGDDGVWSAYFSWNGATEVASWVLQGTDASNETSWKEIASAPKAGFETSILLSADSPAHLRVMALDKTSHVLGISKAVNTSMVDMPYTVIYHKTKGSKSSIFSSLAEDWMLELLALGYFILVIMLSFRPLLRVWYRCRGVGGVTEYELLTEEGMDSDKRMV